MINWHLFSKAITEYEKLGYQLIEVPWLVDKKTIDITLPPDKKPFTVDGCGDINQLVGSAEQSFIYLCLQGKLTKGKYMALTPCFRDDPEDEWHQKYFMKLELIEIGFVSDLKLVNDYNFMIDSVKKVLGNFTTKPINQVFTSDGLDLEIDGIEIGSYGIREYQNITWVYGTGLAEPRFSKVSGI